MNRINTVKLHRLISSLKKEEKRYFKIFTKKQNQKEDIFYLKIFDYLDKLKEVDRDKFKKKFHNVKGLSGLQNYLYKLILKSLRNQSAYNDVDAILREGLADLAILYKKELLIETQEKLQELLEIAEFHDKVFFLPMLHDWWFMLENTRFRYTNVKKSLLDEQVQKYTQTIEDLKEHHFYRTQLGYSMFVVEDKNSRQVFDTVQEMHQALPTYNPQQNKYGISILAQELQLRRILANILMDAQDSYFYANELYFTLKQQPVEIFEANKLYYYGALTSMLVYAPTLERFITIIEEIEEVHLQNPELCNSNIKMHIFFHKIDIYLLSGAFEGFKQFLDENETNVKYIKNYIHSHYPSFFYYKIALYHYATKNNAEALRTIDQFLLNKEVNGLIKNPSLFLKMIIYYEEEEYILLTSFLNNLRRLLRNKELLLDSEKELITLLNGLIKLPQSEHREKLIEARANMVRSLSKLEHHKKEFLVFFNYIGWVDSQISKTPFQQLFFRHIGVIDVV